MTSLPQEPRPPLDDCSRQRIINLKLLSTAKSYECEEASKDALKHLIACASHKLQRTQLEILYEIPARITDIAVLSHDQLDKLPKLLVIDLQKNQSLSAFNAAQKRYFACLEEMRKSDTEILELLKGNEEDPDYGAVQDRLFLLKQSRQQMRESWLEFLDDAV